LRCYGGLVDERQINERKNMSTKSDDSDLMSEPTNSPDLSDTSDEKRRALIRGLAAIPAVITITSRPLWAASGALSGASGGATGAGRTGTTTGTTGNSTSSTQIKFFE
jgi:hypothetical protein